MPSVTANVSMWDQKHDWSEQGEEWSQPWGNSETQWWSSLFPRIHAFVPADCILEIAPGSGRWSEYLRKLTGSFDMVDISQSCIDICSARFAADKHIRYHVNDGTSLDMIADGSIDFVFSFDSLVHCEADVIKAYLGQLAKKLTPDGVGFIHHSNIGAFRSYFDAVDHLPLPRGKGFLARHGVIDPSHWRAPSMTAELFHQYCTEAGLDCIGQELINWRSKRPIDCMSQFTLRGSRWSRPHILIENRNFMAEAEHARATHTLYSGFPGGPR